MKHVDIYLKNAGKSVKKKEITFQMGTHEFSGWLQREIQHKEENKDV